VEGAHAILKYYLELMGKTTIAVVGSAIVDHVRVQHVRWQDSVVKQRGQVSSNHLHPVLRDIRTTVSNHALDLLTKQLALLDTSGLKPCTREFSCVWGLPCVHALWGLVQTGGVLTEAIHGHWEGHG
jgi:hypothetical protein